MSAKEWCEQLELVKPIKIYGKVLPCFDAMVWSINAISMLYTQQKIESFKYLLTSRLNQDIIENTFSVFRQRGGFNRNPTARTFRTSFRFQAKHNLMKSTDLSNCETNYEYNLFDNSSSQSTTISNTCDNSNDSDSCKSLSDNDGYDDEYKNINNDDEQYITLESCSNTYFAGYLAKKCMDQFKCTKCELIILKCNEFFFDDQEYLIFYKQFESTDPEKCSLKKPSDLFTKFVMQAQIILKHFIEVNPQKRKLYTTIQLKIKNEIFFDLNVDKDCEQHFDFIIQKLIYCKLLRHFNWTSKHLKGRSNKSTVSKLNILKNL